MKRFVLVSMLVLCISGLSFGVLAIDGSNADWTAMGTFADAETDHPAGVADLTAWKVAIQKDGNIRYLYSYFQDPRVSEYMPAGNYLFAGTLIDVDRQGGYTNGDGTSVLEGEMSHYGPEFTTPNGLNGHSMMDGTDVWSEWGPNKEGLNWWGASDDIADNYVKYVDAITDGFTAAGTNFVEYKIPVQGYKDTVARSPDGVTPKKVWKVGVRFAAHLASGGNWEGDKSGDALNPAGGVYQVFTYLPVDTIFGDASEDGTVDVSDLGILAANYGTTYDLSTGIDTWAKGDFNADGKIDVSDLGILAANYGTSFGGAVPEPMTMSMLAVGGLALLRRKS